MATLRFLIDVILADGLHRAGSEIKVSEKEAADLSRLTGVKWIDKPDVKKEEPKKRGRPKKRS